MISPTTPHGEPWGAPLSPDYVTSPEYPEYLASSYDEIPIEDQPLPANASTTALSPGYVVESDPLDEDPKEDPEKDPANYPADEGDDDEEEEDSSEDDDDEKEKEASEEDKDEEEEHLAPTDSTTLPAIDPVPSAEKILIAKYASSPIPLSPPPSLLSPLSSLLPIIPSPPLILPPLHTSPTYARVPLGYKAAIVQLRAASPSTYYPLPPPSLSPTPSSSPLTSYSSPLPPIPSLSLPIPSPPFFKVEESSTASASKVMTVVEEVNKRVEDLAATQRQDAHELYTQHDRMEWQRQEAGDMVTRAFGCIHALEARDPARLDDLEDTSNSF
ncbi:hypothetical protein Tco_0427940 [Tanacetum coccineum]